MKRREDKEGKEWKGQCRGVQEILKIDPAHLAPMLSLVKHGPHALSQPWAAKDIITSISVLDRLK